MDLNLKREPNWDLDFDQAPIVQIWSQCPQHKSTPWFKSMALVHVQDLVQSLEIGALVQDWVQSPESQFKHKV